MMEPDVAEEIDQPTNRRGAKFTVVKSDDTLIKGGDCFKPFGQSGGKRDVHFGTMAIPLRTIHPGFS